MSWTMVRDIVTAVFARKVDDTDDIFVVGGDRYANDFLWFVASVLTHHIYSLTAMSIRNSVLRALRKSKVVPVGRHQSSSSQLRL